MAPVDSNLTEVQHVSDGESDVDVGGPSVGDVGPVGSVGLDVEVDGEGGSGDKPLSTK